MAKYTLSCYYSTQSCLRDVAVYLKECCCSSQCSWKDDCEYEEGSDCKPYCSGYGTWDCTTRYYYHKCKEYSDPVSKLATGNFQCPDNMVIGESYVITYNNLSVKVESGATLSNKILKVTGSLVKISLKLSASGYTSCTDSKELNLVAKRNQTITVSSPDNFIVGSIKEISVEASSGLSDFILSSESVHVTVLGKSLLFTKCGIFIVKVIQPGNEDYYEAVAECVCYVGIDNLSPVLLSSGGSDVKDLKVILCMLRVCLYLQAGSFVLNREL